MKPIALKRCKECGLTKTVRDFYKTGSGNPRGRCKECIRAAKRRRYRADPEKYKEQVRQWRSRNPNRVKAYEARSRQRRIEANRERVKRWRKENPELWKKQQEQSLRKERERGFPNAAKRRALQHGAFVEVVDKRTLYLLHEGLCGLCGEPLEYAQVTIDHIVPLSRGGKHEYENCQLAHGLCNRKKGNKLPEELEAA